MKKKMLKSMTILVIISILLTFSFTIYLLYDQSHRQMEETVQNEAGYVGKALEDYGEDYLGAEVDGISASRITLIDSGGTVLYDSAENPADMENHKDRPEVKEALTTGSGKEIRLSATLGEETFYYAMRLSDGNIVRIARTTDSVFLAIKNSIVPLVLIFIIVIVIAILLTKRQTENLVAPLNALDLEHPLDNDIYEEMSPLLTRINQQNVQIEKQVTTLKEKQEEYEAITENMKDGLIVTDRSVILSINKKAAELFHVNKEECLHKNILTLSRNQELKHCLELSLEGQYNYKVVELDGRNYQLMGNTVKVDGEIRGAVIFLLDITEKSQSERMRREFSANVSHELKTPLMSISGYAELMVNNMVKPENMQEFAGRIYQEATRLSKLVSDIIKLSKLDEQEDKLPMEEDVDLWSMATDVSWQLQAMAAEKSIQIKLEGEPAKIKGNTQVLSEMMYNLCENALKYNIQGGKVILGIYPGEKNVNIVVEDTGIGIPAAEQERIFERFYRVDKSRSQEIEGTGLGLSIVKHSVLLHHGTINLESVVGQGSKMTVTLPRE